VAPHAEIIAPDDEILARFKGKFTETPYVGELGADYGPAMQIAKYCSQAEPKAHFAAMVTRLDIQVGEIVSKLKELGLDKNTIIFFSSDNGPHQEGGANPDFFTSSGPFKGVKRDLTEGGIRLPLIAYAPGIVIEGVQSDQICAMWDMLPTIANITGAKLNKNAPTDGISILPTLTGKGKQQQHEFLYWEFHEQGGKIAVRKGNWKLIIKKVLTNKDAVPELYNLATDIHEDMNVANQYPELVKEFLEIMKKSHID
jgi:arylsulfatase A-like enzyme